jgi:hypothetical protein
MEVFGSGSVDVENSKDEEDREKKRGGTSEINNQFLFENMPAPVSIHLQTLSSS